MVSARDVVTAARGWVGVPVRHQGESKLAGCDCAGLVRGVGSELGLFPPDVWAMPKAKRWKGYGREPVGTFLEAMAQMLEPSAQIDVGSVVAIRFTGPPRHCAIVGDHPLGGLTLIHAYKTEVVEHILDARWRKRIVGVYAFPGVMR